MYEALGSLCLIAVQVGLGADVEDGDSFEAVEVDGCEDRVEEGSALELEAATAEVDIEDEAAIELVVRAWRRTSSAFCRFCTCITSISVPRHSNLMSLPPIHLYEQSEYLPHSPGAHGPVSVTYSATSLGP